MSVTRTHGDRGPAESVARCAARSRTAACRADRPSHRRAADRCPSARRGSATEPSTTAVVYGDSCGRKRRTYGSSDVSNTLTVTFASHSGVIAMLPTTDTDRRGEAASSCSVISSPLTLMMPLIWPMPSSATNTSDSVPWTSYFGASNVPLPAAVKLSSADSGKPMRLAGGDRFGLDGLRVEAERVGAVPADVGVAGAAAAAFQDLDVRQPHALPLEQHGARGAVHRLAVEHGVGNLHPAGPIRREVFAGDGELAAQQAVDVVVVDGEGVPQVGDRPARDRDPRVDLLAAVAPREPQREASVVVITDEPDVMMTSVTST